MKLIAFGWIVVSAAILMGCTTSKEGAASPSPKNDVRAAARAIVGTSLIGVRGATPEDQENIDDTAAGVCGAGVWTKDECRAHTEATK